MNDVTIICFRCEYIITCDDLLNCNCGKINDKMFHKICYYKYKYAKNDCECNHLIKNNVDSTICKMIHPHNKCIN